LDVKDPDQLVRTEGIDAWRKLVDRRECGIVWRAKEMVGDVSPDAPEPRRREVLRRVGLWLGSLPPRLALEQEDAVRAAAERCGYSPTAVQRYFQARFLREVTSPLDRSPARGRLDRRVEDGVEL
jgi:DNA primase